MSPGDLDLVMSDGLGMRYAFIGPLETMHLNAEGRLPSRRVQGGILCCLVLLWFCNGQSCLFLQLNRNSVVQEMAASPSFTGRG